MGRSGASVASAGGGGGHGFLFWGAGKPFPLIIVFLSFVTVYGTEDVRTESRTDKVLMVTRRR